jgi:fido (protein-threonine AMPylation protein)
MAAKRTSKSGKPKSSPKKAPTPKSPKKGKPAPKAGKSSASRPPAKVEKPARKVAPPKKEAPSKKASTAASAKAPAAKSATAKAPPKPAAPSKGAAPPRALAGKVASKAPPSKTPAPKTAEKAKPPKPLTKPPKGGAPPPPKSEATVVRTKSGESLTLLPARTAGISPRPSSPGEAKAAKSSPSKPGQRPLVLTRTASDRPPAGFVQASMPLPVRRAEPTLTIEERFRRLDATIEGKDEEAKAAFYRLYDLAWVSHDSALEGTVYTREEIEAGFAKDPLLIDGSLQPAVDEIRRHREAIEYVRDFGLRKKLPVTVDVIRKLYLILHPSEGDLKTVKYRKDIPQHRLYFHEYAAPDKIAYKVRLVVDWLNEPETRKTRNAVRIAARAHYDLLRVFPFPVDSGKVSRLFMNLLLYRAGYPPAIIHAKERQAYYEALKGEPNKILRIVSDAVEDGLTSIEKFFEEQDAKKRPLP